MAALTEKQRRYVLAMLSDPLGNPTRWARAAGYSDHKQNAKTQAHRLVHTLQEQLMDAAQEEARRHLLTVGPILGIGVMMQIARKNGHKKQLAAAIALADRAGFHAKTEHSVSVEHTDSTGRAMAERIKELAGVLGVDAAKLLGEGAAGEPMKLIEGEVVDAGRTED